MLFKITSYKKGGLPVELLIGIAIGLAIIGFAVYFIGNTGGKADGAVKSLTGCNTYGAKCACLFSDKDECPPEYYGNAGAKDPVRSRDCPKTCKASSDSAFNAKLSEAKKAFKKAGSKDESQFFGYCCKGIHYK